MLCKSDRNNIFSWTESEPSGSRAPDSQIEDSSMCVVDNNFIYVTGGELDDRIYTVC